jgi:hypothetical protein
MARLSSGQRGERHIRVRLSLPNPGNQLPSGMHCHVTFIFPEQAPVKFEASSRPGTSRSVNIDPSAHKAD